MSDMSFVRDAGMPTALRVAQVVGLTSTAFLAGRTFTQTFSAVPALLHAPAPLLAKQWKTIFDSDKFLAPLIVLNSSAVFGWVAWRDRTTSSSSTFWNATAAAFLLLTIPYSLFFLEPITRKLEEKARTLTEFAATEDHVEKEQNTHWLVDRWATVNLGRALIVGMAAVDATWAALGAAGAGAGPIGTGVRGGVGRMGR